MGSIEERSNGWRVVWRYQGRKEYTIAWPEWEQADKAEKIAKAHGHKITAKQVPLGQDGVRHPV